jgi:hypothetical protein
VDSRTAERWFDSLAATYHEIIPGGSERAAVHGERVRAARRSQREHDLGFGRIVTSKIQAPNMLMSLV